MAYLEKRKFHLKTRIKSFTYAIEGIKYLIKTQHNIWIHLFATCIVIILGLFLNVSLTEWCLLILAIGWVLFSEAFNTALESLTDLTTHKYHKLAKITKDVGAAAVLISAITSAIIGLLIFVPKITKWLSLHLVIFTTWN